ncbi:MAG: hypothetical protein ACK5H2_00510 [Beutenbergiaceae bacterium]
MTTEESAANARPINRRRRAVLLGAALPAAEIGLAIALIAAWIPRLPDPLALHWGLDGVDRVGGLSGLLVPMVVVGALLCLPLMVGSVLARRGMRRGIIGLSAGMTTMFAGMTLGMVAVQLDAADAYSVGQPGAAIALPMLAGLAVGAIAAWLAGPDAPAPTVAPIPADAARMPLPTGGQAVWIRTLPTMPLLIPAVAVAGLLALGIVLGIQTGSWWMLLPAIVVALVLVLTLGWRAQVDRTGLTVRGLIGWPRFHLPADEIVQAEVTEVNPVREFGGLGVRAGHGNTLGFITRKGEGIHVQRTQERAVVVTIDDAARAVALLNTLAERTRPPSAD